MIVSQNSFIGGLIDPDLEDRIEFTSTSLKKCTNFFNDIGGSLYARQGFKYIAQYPFNTIIGIYKFEFNSEQSYLLVFEPNKLSIIKADDIVNNTFTVQAEISTYISTKEQFENLYFSQNKDLLTIVSLEFTPHELRRKSNTDWELVEISYTIDIPAPTITSVTTVGTDSTPTANKSYTYAVTVVNDQGIESLISNTFNFTMKSQSVTLGARITFNAPQGVTVDHFNIYKETNSSQFFGYIGRAEKTSTIFDDYNTAPLESISPPADRLPFKDGNNPSVITYYQQRSIYANTVNNPETLYASQVKDIYSFRVSSASPQAADAITENISSTKENEIRHLIPLGSLNILTAGSRLTVRDTDAGEFKAPLYLIVRSSVGASKVKPVIVGDDILFVESKNKQIIRIPYEESGRLQDLRDDLENDMTILRRSFFKNETIKKLVVENNGFYRVWILCESGVIYTMVYSKQQKVSGLQKIETNGFVKDIESLSFNSKDYVVIVKSFNNYDLLEFLPELIIDEDNLSAYNGLDSSIVYQNGVEFDYVNNINHLANQKVNVLTTEGVVNNLTVNSAGELFLPYKTTKVLIGMSYRCIAETFQLVPTNNAILIFDESKVTKVIVSIYQGRSLLVYTIDENNAIEVKTRKISNNYTNNFLLTEKLEVNLKTGRNDYNSKSVGIIHSDPFPIKILSIAGVLA